ncbi:hypothetical protein N7535_003985 [Penicillium sp. DV-2018c]|nr:hypothetical protein N7535_003985 [Penicillium sp. DV-2018c]
MSGGQAAKLLYHPPTTRQLPGGPPTVRRPVPRELVSSCAASSRGDHRRSNDPVPRELVNLLALPAPGGPTTVRRPVPRELANSSRHLGGLPPSKLRACSGQVAEMPCQLPGD